MIWDKDTWEKALADSSLPAELPKATTVKTVQSAELSPGLLSESNWKKKDLATEEDLDIIDISGIELSVSRQKK